MKLNFGCGDHILDGWINADRQGQPPCVDHGAFPIVTEEPSLPWEDDTFDQVMMVHAIEHIPLEGSLAIADHTHRGQSPPLTVQEILAELHRVTKPGGSCFFIAPDILKLLDFWLKLHKVTKSYLSGPMEGMPYRETNFFIPESCEALCKPGVLDDWLSRRCDPHAINTRRHDWGISTAEYDSDPTSHTYQHPLPEDRDAPNYSYNDMETIVKLILQEFFGNIVLENDTHFAWSDHRWNCYEERLFNLVSEHFPTSRTVERPEDEGPEGFRNFRWVDENEREWLTRSWNPFNCAVLATK